MGISSLIALKATVMFVGFICLRSYGFRWISLPVLHGSLVALLVSIASHPYINIPLLLGKRSDGGFPIWAKIAYGPFLLFIRTFVNLRRLKMREPPYNKVSEGLYVGGWPSSVDYLPPGDPAIIDCTCELPRSSVTSKNAYLCIATWDTRAPHPAVIEQAVLWASQKRAQKKPVYIHCAFGHGRSVCVMCAVLVSLNVAEDWKSAEKLIREKRPCIQMNSLHRKHLEEWSKYHHLSKKSKSNISPLNISCSSNN